MPAIAAIMPAVTDATRTRSDIVYEHCVMISSGWLANAALRGMPDEVAVLHFAKLGCALLEPYCTLRGKLRLRQIWHGAYDGD